MLDKLTYWYEQEKGGLLMSRDSWVTYSDLIVELRDVGMLESSKSSDPRVVEGLEKMIAAFRVSLQRDLGVREEIPKS